MKSESYKKFQAVIFDLDGTLIDSLEDLTDACNAMLAHYDLPPKSYEEGKTLIGRGLRNLVKRALPESMRSEEIIEEAHQLMQSEYAKRYTNKTRPYEGIKETLAFLQANNIPFALNTNKPDHAAKIIIDAMFDIEDFTDVIGQSDDWPRKPDPTMALKLADKMHVAPEDCIYCGDSLVDYETGINAGMHPLLCTWGFTKPEVLHELEQGYCLDDSTMLKAYFEDHIQMA